MTSDLRRVAPERRPAVAADLSSRGEIDWDALRAAAAGCHACPLWERATQTVFGTGPMPAPLMLIGEQPGDREDLAGQPFVGPAGRVLDEALSRAGIDRETVFVTNVVKHFKWRPAPGGKRRLHERPDRSEVGACLPWVESELALVRPQGVVLLGSTAAEAFLGPAIRVTRDHGRALDSDIAPFVTATIHPSAVLRMSTREARETALAGLSADLEATLRRLGSATA